METIKIKYVLIIHCTPANQVIVYLIIYIDRQIDAYFCDHKMFMCYAQLPLSPLLYLC